MNSSRPNRRIALAALNAGAMSLALASTGLRAQGKKINGPGVTDTEILIGQTMPYSGAASALSIIGKIHEGYFQMINERGGINGRKLRLISLDDNYSAPRAIEQVRRLVEQDQVALIFGTVGTPANTVSQKYLNAKKIPQLFISGASNRFYDPKNSPWTISSSASLHGEGVAHAKYLLKEKPDAKVAVIFQNDDYGKDYVSGLTGGLGAQAPKTIVASASYEPTDPTIDSQIITLKASGADVLVIYCAPKAAAQSIRKAAELGWKPMQILASGSRSISTVLTPAGLENSVGLLTMSRFVDLEDPEVGKRADMIEYFSFMKKYAPGSHPNEGIDASGYLAAYLLVEVLKKCGDDLTRENIMKQATTLKNLPVPLLLPGVTVSTTPADYEITKAMTFNRFDGKRWAPFGQPIPL